MSSVTMSRGDFMNNENEFMLNRILYKDFQRRLGTNLDEKQMDRLQRTTRYYMKQVMNENPKNSVKDLNTEVLKAVVPDYLSYIRRKADVPENQDSTLEMDVSSRFEKVQNERQAVRAPIPPEPSFRIPLDDEPTSMSEFERIRKQREEEARRYEQTSTQLTTVPSTEENNSDYLTADNDFREQNQRAQNKQTTLLVEREKNRMLSRAETMEVRPDRREIYETSLVQQDQAQLGIRPSQGPGYAQPATLALPSFVRDRPSLPQDLLRSQDSIVSYKEVEYNLFLNSADRDWTNSSNENRYNFRVNFDPANNRPGDNFGLSPAANIKFKNISRIELVKVYLPVEGNDIAITKDVSNVYLNDLNLNVLGFPFVHVRISELENNGFGTNNNIDNAFGVVSYDATWTADAATKGKGFTRLIPKFLKAQKEYLPTPLATLQRLSIRLERPNGELLSSIPDTLDMSGFYLSSQIIANPGPGPNKISGTPYVDLSGYHIWIQTKTWFNQNLFAQGDQLLCKNLSFPNTVTAGSALTDFTTFLTQKAGQYVIDVGQLIYNGSKYVYTNTPNLAGYCNCIIIQNRFADPSTGAIGLLPFGGTTAASAALFSNLVGKQVTSGRLINVSNQSQLVFRIITREMDPTSRIRPDNMNA